MKYKTYLALMIAGFLVAGYGLLYSPVAQAAAPCEVFTNERLGNNPELLKIKCSDVIVEEDNRYTALSKYYLALDEAIQQRSNSASTARYEGLATFLTDESNDTIQQRSNSASTSRYEGLAAFLTESISD